MSNLSAVEIDGLKEGAPSVGNIKFYLGYQ